MSRKMNLVFALGALMIMSGFAIGQTAKKGLPITEQTMQARPPRGGFGDPCSPSFPGTVFVPCNTAIGSLVWNDARHKYDVRLDETVLKQAYASGVERARQAEKTAGRVPPPIPEFRSWLEMLRDTFGQLVGAPCGDPTGQTGGDPLAMKPPSFTGGVGYDGGWTFNAGFTWQLGK